MTEAEIIEQIGILYSKSHLSFREINRRNKWPRDKVWKIVNHKQNGNTDDLNDILKHFGYTLTIGKIGGE